MLLLSGLLLTAAYCDSAAAVEGRWSHGISQLSQSHTEWSDSGMAKRSSRLAGSVVDGSVPHNWRSTIDDLHSSGQDRAGMGLNVRDFGAVGDGVCAEAADRSWTKCTGRDESPAIQRAIDAAQHLGQTLYVPAGVYMVNTTLIIRKPNENASISKPQPYVTAGLRIVGEGMATTIFVAQCTGGAGCMQAVVMYDGNEVEPDLEGVTGGHSMESLSVSAAKLATYGIYGPAIIWSRWHRVGVFDASNGAGMRLIFGFCLRLVECNIGSNPGANLIGLHATSDVNNLDVVDSLFHGSHQFAAILISGGMQIRLSGNVIEGFGGPAIVVNDVFGLSITSNYFEGDDENAWEWQTIRGPVTSCSDIVLNGHGPDSDAQAGSRPGEPVSCNAADCWANSSQYLHSLGNDPAYLVRGAVVQGNFHQPGSLVQVNSQCRGARSSILAAGVDGLVVTGETALNAGPSTGPAANGGDPGGCPLIATGTDPTVWTAKEVRVVGPVGYSKNNILALLQSDCRLCTDVEIGATAILEGEPVHDYGQLVVNQSLWSELSLHGSGSDPILLPVVTQLPASQSYEQSPTFRWAMRVPHDDREPQQPVQVGATAVSIALAQTPSLASVLENGVPMPASLVVGVNANLSCVGRLTCTLHFAVRSVGTNASGSGDWTISHAVNHTNGVWGAHTFPFRLSANVGDRLEVGVVITAHTSDVATGLVRSQFAPGDDVLLGTLAGFTLRRLGAARQM